VRIIVTPELEAEICTLRRRIAAGNVAAAADPEFDAVRAGPVGHPVVRHCLSWKAGWGSAPHGNGFASPERFPISRWPPPSSRRGLSYAKVRAITRAATPATEAMLVDSPAARRRRSWNGSCAPTAGWRAE